MTKKRDTRSAVERLPTWFTESPRLEDGVPDRILVPGVFRAWPRLEMHFQAWAPPPDYKRQDDRTLPIQGSALLTEQLLLLCAMPRPNRCGLALYYRHMQPKVYGNGTDVLAWLPFQRTRRGGPYRLLFMPAWTVGGCQDIVKREVGRQNYLAYKKVHPNGRMQQRTMVNRVRNVRYHRVSTPAVFRRFRGKLQLLREPVRLKSVATDWTPKDSYIGEM